MKINTGLAVNSLLVVLGLLLIIVPAQWMFSVLDTLPFFMEEKNGSMKSAIESIFYDGKDHLYGSQITPVIDYQDPNLADLPPQVTPQLVAKIMSAQAIVNTTISDARFAMQWIPIIVGILCAIGAMSVLIGIGMIITQRKLDKIIESKK